MQLRTHLCHVAVPLLLGGMLYLGFRSEQLLMFHWATALHVNNVVEGWRALCREARLPGWLVYSVPTTLWAYAVVAFFALLWRGDRTKARVTFYYLLAEGSVATPPSPTCNGSNVVGIGRADAERIWYRALTTYMTTTTNYAQARIATLKAGRDLFGNPSTQLSAVDGAWAAVSVG